MNYKFLVPLLALIAGIQHISAQVTTIPAGTTVNTEQVVGNGQTLNVDGVINTSGTGNDGVDVDTTGTGSATVNVNGTIRDSAADDIQIDTSDSSSVTVNISETGVLRSAISQSINIDAEDNSTVTINNHGIIRDTGSDGILIDDAEDNATVIINNHGTIRNTAEQGIEIDDAMDNATVIINNYGTIRDTSSEGIKINNATDNSTVTVINHGAIRNAGNDGIEGDAEDTSRLTIINNGRIADSQGDGIDVSANINPPNSATVIVINNGIIDDSTANGITGLVASNGNLTITNTGTIRDSGTDGIFGNNTGLPNNATLTINHSGIIDTSGGRGIQTQGGPATINLSGKIRNTTNANSIEMGNNDDILNVFGRALIDKIADGGGENAGDTINFNLRGINAADQATFDGLVFDGSQQTVSIFGRDFVFVDFEVGTVSLASYSSLLPDHLAEFGSFLDNLNGTPDFLLDVLNVLSAAPVGTDLNNAITNLTGLDGIEQYKREASSFGPDLSRSLGQYFHNLRQGGTGWDTSQVSLYDPNLPLAMQPQTQQRLFAGTTLSDENLDKVIQDNGPATDWGGFVQIQGTYSEQDANENFAAADATSVRVNVGADKRVTENLAVGAMIGYAHTDATIDGLGSEVIDNSPSIGLYTHFSEGNSFVEGMIGYRAHFYEQDRNIIAAGGTATSDTIGHQLPASLRVGHDFKFGEDLQWTLTPQAAVHYSLLYVDGYSESGAGALSLIVGDMSAQSLQSEAGFRLARRYAGNYGWFSPSLYASYNHEFLDENTSVSSRFSGGLTPFAVQTAEPERDFAILGLGLDGSPADCPDLHFGIRYDVQVGQEDYLSHAATAHIRLDL